MMVAMGERVVSSRAPQAGGGDRTVEPARMRVDRFATPHTSAFEGRTYYFCSSGCKEEFETKPEYYARHARGSRGGRPRGLLRART